MKVLGVFLCMLFWLMGGTVQGNSVVDLTVSPDEVVPLTQGARAGDQESMWRLYQHYSQRADARHRAYWGERLAQLNDRRVLLDLADFYDSLGTPFLCDRAVSLAEQLATLSTNTVEQGNARKIASHYAGKHEPLGKCGRQPRPNQSFKPTPLRGAA
jgi:hypothetical protein